jgi:hypothetical protein
MRINFFGCSFTEGGGLDNIDYYNFKTNSKLKDYTSENNYFLRKFKEKYRYTNVVEKLTKCKIRNFATGCNSNENIINKLFEIVNSDDIKEDDIFVVQTSIHSRKHFWYEPTQEFYSVNTLEMSGWPYQNKDIMKKLNELYNLYFTYSHNQEYEIKKLLMQIDLCNSYFKEKGLKIFWMPWPDFISGDWNLIRKYNSKLIDKNFIFFDGVSMGTFIDSNGYRIRDEFSNSIDSHKSVKGHRIVAERVTDYLKENKII